VRRAGLLLLCLAAAVRAQDDEALEKARAKVRALEADIQSAIAKVAPTVGAVINYRAFLDEKTGAVRMAPLSLGSGVVISRDGFFLTNVHVVERAGYLRIMLPDGGGYTATLYADTSEGQVKGDIALLKLKGKKNYDYANWRTGRPKQLEPGSFVFAMGNPHGHALDGTPVTTMGILSGKGRAAAEARYLYVDALQTDAEINPGNSGGPLFDSRGNLIGINGLMASRQGRSNSGVGFAIPIDQIRLFLRKLLKDEGGGVGYGYHGLRFDSAAAGKGAVLSAIDHLSPAQKAGLRKGDRIVKANGAKIANRTDLVNVLGKLPEGSRVRLSYKRGRAGKMATFRLVPYTEYLESVGRQRRKPGSPLPMNERGYLGVHWKSGRTGLRITRIIPGTGAAKSSLKVEDLIREVDGRPVPDAKELIKILATKAVGETVRVAYTREEAKKATKVLLCDAAQAAEMTE
jgi:serine protease Do